LPLQSGTFVRWKPEQALLHNYNGHYLVPRKALQTLSFAEGKAPVLTFPTTQTPIFPAAFTNRFDAEPHRTLQTLQTLQVYPNPTTGTLYIQAKEDLAFDVIDIHGRTVLTHIAIERNNTVASINIAFLPAGIYTIMAQGALTKQRYYTKIVKL
jgi:hypothetical protein